MLEWSWYLCCHDISANGHDTCVVMIFPQSCIKLVALLTVPQVYRILAVMVVTSWEADSPYTLHSYRQVLHDLALPDGGAKAHTKRISCPWDPETATFRAVQKISLVVLRVDIATPTTITNNWPLVQNINTFNKYVLSFLSLKCVLTQLRVAHAFDCFDNDDSDDGSCG